MPRVPILFLNRELIDTSLVAPVTTRAALFCIFFKFVYLVLGAIIPYNIGILKSGRIKEKYIVCSDFLSSLNLNLRMTLMRLHAFDLM